MRVKLPFAVSLNSILLVKGGNWVGLNTLLKQVMSLQKHMTIYVQTLKGFRITINKNVASACFFRDSK